MIGHSCSPVPLDISWCAFHTVQGYKTHLHLALPSFAHKAQHTLSLRSKRCTTLVVPHIAHRAVRQDISVHVHHSNASGESGFNVMMAHSHSEGRVRSCLSLSGDGGSCFVGSSASPLVGADPFRPPVFSGLVRDVSHFGPALRNMWRVSVRWQRCWLQRIGAQPLEFSA